MASEKNIRFGFRLLNHQLTFGDFTPENIRENDLVIPLNINDLRELKKYPHLTENKLIPTPSIDAIDICDDKYLFIQTMIENGFGDLIPKIGTDLPVPFMLKKRVSSSGNSCYFISSPEQQKEYQKLILDPDYFCQQVVGGADEYATHILFKNNKIVSSLTIKYTFFSGLPINGKEKMMYSYISKCNYLDKFSAILNSIGYEGLCCFDYKVINGKPQIFEINPRFGGSLSAYFFTFMKKVNSEEVVSVVDL
jgi:carbamoylphosphate synthase large subunit